MAIKNLNYLWQRFIVNRKLLSDVEGVDFGSQILEGLEIPLDGLLL